jgi:CRISPR/Cas system-associated exonuclease Cas4 (RecB family)
MICSRTLQIPAERIHGVLLILGRNRLSPKIEYSPYEENDLDVRKEQIRTMEALVDELLTEIVDPRPPFEPAPAAEGTCEGCPFAYICNRQ